MYVYIYIYIYIPKELYCAFCWLSVANWLFRNVSVVESTHPEEVNFAKEMWMLEHIVVAVKR